MGRAPKTFTITVKRRTLVAAAVGLAATVTTIILFGRWAWLADTGLVVFAMFLLHMAARPRVRRVRTVVDNAPSPDARVVADAVANAIRDAERTAAFRRL